MMVTHQPQIVCKLSSAGMQEHHWQRAVSNTGGGGEPSISCICPSRHPYWLKDQLGGFLQLAQRTDFIHLPLTTQSCLLYSSCCMSEDRLKSFPTRSCRMQGSWEWPVKVLLRNALTFRNASGWMGCILEAQGGHICIHTHSAH